MTYEVEKEMVLKIGVMPVIEYLQENHIWIDPDGDMDPLELLNYTAQIVQAKEVSEYDIVQWLDRIRVSTSTLDEKDGCPFDPASVTSKVTLSINADGAPFNAIGKIDDTSFVSGYTSLDLDKISGFQKWPVAEQGNGPTMIPVNSPMDEHANLLKRIGLGDPEQEELDENDITDKLVDQIIDRYVNVCAGQKFDELEYVAVDIQRDGSSLILSTDVVQDLAKRLTSKGMFTVVYASPFSEFDCNRIEVGLSSSYKLNPFTMIVNIK